VNELDPSDDGKESAAKNLSLKLLGSTDPHEILRIFENDFIRQPDRMIYGEELVMVLKFLQHALKEHMDRKKPSMSLRAISGLEP